MFSKMSERMTLAVDWDARSLRLVHARVRKGAIQVDRMLSVDVPPGLDVADPQALGPRDLDNWSRELDNYVIADAFADLVSRGPHAVKKMEKWSRRGRSAVEQRA